MEHWGRRQDYVQSTLHTPSSSGRSQNHGGQTVAGATTDFHVYAMEWNPERMIFSVDGKVHYTYEPEVKDARTWPFNTDLYLLLNVAVLPTVSPDFESGALEIDYVRVYQ
jgi:beta-glucanase (GH16 family)